MGRKEEIFHFLQTTKESYSAQEVAEKFQLDRTNVSRYLNELYKEKKIEKGNGKPIKYRIPSILHNYPFRRLIGADGSLKVAVQQAQAAILYPPRGLHTLILGKTGTGKSLFAECMYEYAKDSKVIRENAPFITFNCADYSQNPQLLYGHIFGIKKGAFTGADIDRPGLLEKCDHGILFLDEIHRLPHEGQEMLFTFIDKGEFRRLGETESLRKASVQIIGATTEIPESFLLETFTRRIPMTITLPPLKDRRMEERYELIEYFLIQESKRLNETVYVDRRALSALLLYHTSANIGQLQRDLKLACAKAFLNYKSLQIQYLHITQMDLPVHVQKGLLDTKEFREKMNKLIGSDQEIFKFHERKNMEETVEREDSFSLYDVIERKLHNLHQDGRSEAEIQKEILVDINQYFNQYLDQLPVSNVNEVVNEYIWGVTERIYQFAEQELKRTFSKKMKFAFALHLQGTIDRIRQNSAIYHPNLNEIRKKYSMEFKISIEIAQMIEQELNVEIPLDEIGYITMFLVSDVEENMYHQEQLVGIIVMMHGKSTATSMLQTVQELLGVQQGKALDMPLSMEVGEMYERVKNAVKNMNHSKGILFLVDMGSLSSFGNLIFEETGVRTRTISMTSTPVVMEAVRKASLGRSLDDIYQSCLQLFDYQSSTIKSRGKSLKKAIITACFTGEGVALKLKAKLKSLIGNRDIELLSLQFLNRQAFTEKIAQITEQYDILAIVGTVHFQYDDIPFYSAIDIFQTNSFVEIEGLIKDDEPFLKMAQSLEGHIKTIPSIKQLIQRIRHLMHEIERKLNVILEDGVDKGIIIHLIFLIENMKLNQPVRKFHEFEQFRKKYAREMSVIKETMASLEKEYHFILSKSEIAYLCQMFMENRK
ncbi:sigma 54-interacting transcriptional regulator [Heyndrickxia sporothermodurans]|uniref:Sigma 54-interacting transcriptional regulator n=1 Tax=Heyndrickxia sporothermodurans TaxID=46224 RepID=A0AB37HM98_9BACI|nr:sigma-54-dependent transcriptional regulator [Heyndrickxia sporothermodurans]MBL5771457.1 sigma 54-interacting transcriptional regulator [Heyndrickxia sporothermodurans]MBL5774857.1 sigma 54-interacting transcriptional regulator [Heyndrickxia sporothermodurans]MBL5778562.1 sigma 54-interacting transcriptional regulator [Heyndrickxia sporothermodurans]MBL5789121.1 sigma 54-interacting transcriptional regulator [Heyndrickxia sporothermodurans]MBL5793350.1 sigma 54-interacting transcriptional 